MNIQEAKQIKIADYLQSLGHRPVKQQGANLWYKSPLRNESEASFKVNTTMNSWFDFGMGKGGNIITLVSYLYASDSLPYLLDKMEKQTPHVRPTDFSFTQQATEPSFERLEVRELNHPALLRYLSERKINLYIARKECVELHFSHNWQELLRHRLQEQVGWLRGAQPILQGGHVPQGHHPYPTARRAKIRLLCF